jgi:hypothetical protein
MAKKKETTVAENVLQRTDREMLEIGDYSQYANYLGSAFPSDNVPVFRKSQRDWNFLWINAIIGQYFSGRTVINYLNRDQMILLRSFASGSQPINRYYGMLFGKKVVEDPAKLQDRLGLFRSQFQIESPAPALGKYVFQKWQDAQFFIEAESYSPYAQDKKRKRQYESLAKGMVSPEALASMQQMGLQVPMNDAAESPLEIELIQDIGGYKDAEEMSAETLLNHTDDISESQTKEVLQCEDAICFNKIVSKVHFDRHQGKIVERYVDPVNFVAKTRDNVSPDNLIYAGEFRLAFIKDIRAQAKATGTEISEAQLMSAAKTFMDSYGNNRFVYNKNSFEFSSTAVGYTYDFFRVLVFDAVYLSIDREYKTIQKDERGKMSIKVFTAEELEQGLHKQFETTQSTTERYYRCSTVIGTPIVFDFGPNRNQTDDGDYRADCPYKMTIRPGRSMIDLCVPVLDDFALDYLKYENEKTRALTYVRSIDRGAFAKKNKDGTGETDYEQIELMGYSNQVFYNSVSRIGTAQINLPKPIEILPGEAQLIANNYLQKLNVNAQRLIMISGVDKVQAMPRMTNETVQIAEQTNEAGLSTILSMKFEHKKKVAKSTFNLIKLGCRYSQQVRENYTPIIGELFMKALVSTGNIDASALGIRIVPKLSTTEIQMDLQHLEKMRTGGTGQTAFPVSAYFYIRRALLSGRVKQAQAYMLAVEDKEKKMNAMVAQQNSQYQATMLKEQEQVKAALGQKLIWEQAKADVWANSQMSHSKLVSDMALQSEENGLNSPQNQES